MYSLVAPPSYYIHSSSCHFVGVAIASVGVSVFGTSVLSLIPVMSCDLFGKANVTTVIGIGMFYQAFAQLISATAVGKYL